jgi:transposase-like protein
MGKQYTPEERHEAVKLASEIGTRAASERLGINIDTVYTWVSKARQRDKVVQAAVQEKGPEGLLAESEALKKTLREREQEVEILQEALSFFVKRQKR